MSNQSNKRYRFFTRRQFLRNSATAGIGLSLPTIWEQRKGAAQTTSMSTVVNVKPDGARNVLQYSNGKRFIMKGTHSYAIQFYWVQPGPSYDTQWSPGAQLDHPEIFDNNFNNRSAQLDAMKANGFNTVRVFYSAGFAYEVHNPYGSVDAYIQKMSDYIDTVTSKDMFVYLNDADPLVVSDADFNAVQRAFINKIVNTLANHNNVFFGTINEHKEYSPNWEIYSNRLIDAYRAAGYTGPIIVDAEYISRWNDNGANAIRNHDANVVFSEHTYPGSYSDGTYGQVSSHRGSFATVIGEYGAAWLSDSQISAFVDLCNTGMNGAVAFNWNWLDGLAITTNNDGLNLNNTGFRVKSLFNDPITSSYGNMFVSDGGPSVTVTGVSVSPTSASFGVNATTQLTATLTPSNATNKNVSWSSSNTGIATVDASGLVTGKAAGSATITVTTQDGGKTATSVITVSGVAPVTTKYEAEQTNKVLGGNAAVYNVAPASGGKLVGNITGSTASFSKVTVINGGSGGTATLRIGYANANTGTRQMKLYVNDTFVQIVDFAKTASWSTIAETGDISINLNAGTGNSIKLEWYSQNNVDVDYYKVTK